MSVQEFDDELLDAIANDYVTEAEMGNQLMMSSINDRCWPYVAGLMLMSKSYKELSTHPDIQLFIRRILADWGEEFPHEFWEGLDQTEGLKVAASAIKRYNKVKTGTVDGESR